MSEQEPPLADEEQIGRLHDALAWYTAPPEPDLAPFVRRDVIPPHEMPPQLAAMFPPTTEKILAYALVARGAGRSCLHYLEQGDNCLSANLVREQAGSDSLAILLNLSPVMLSSWDLAHMLTCVFPPADQPDEHARYAPGIRVVKAVIIETGVQANEVDGLIDMLVQDNIPPEYRPDYRANG